MIGLTIDPGVMTGACLFTYNEEMPFTILKLWQFPGGADAIRQFLINENIYVDDWMKIKMGRFPVVDIDSLIVEKFTPRPDERFNLTLDAVEPLRGEGVLIGRGFGDLIQWREPSQQYYIGPPSQKLEDKRKASRKFLETHNILPTGSWFGQKDANDAVSAILHSIGWLRKRKHIPTLMEFFPPKEL